jgi:SAM-dependent methyltransferase
MIDWSYVLHSQPNHTFDPDNLNKFFLERAKITTKTLELDKSKNLDILEIGCGIGHLSSLLSNDHNVVSVDNLRFHYNDKNYQSYLKNFNWPRTHFYIKLPYHKHKDFNTKMFENLKKFNKSFDYVIWQNSCLLDQPELTLNCLRSLFFNLLGILKPHGKLIIGFDCFDNSKIPFYNFLNQWQLQPQSQYVIIGSLCICLTKINTKINYIDGQHNS